LGFAVVSCSHETPLDEQVAQSATAAVEPAPQEPAGVVPPPGLRKVDTPACLVGSCETEFPSLFAMQDIRQSDTHLYLAFKYRGGPPASGGIAAAELDIIVRDENCRVGRVTGRGAVHDRADTVSWIEVPLSMLPDGELQLGLRGRVGTAAVASSLHLRKGATGVTYLPMSQRKGYREVQFRHPTTGESLRAATIDEECEP
jgi:hypothetical protein